MLATDVREPAILEEGPSVSQNSHDHRTRRHFLRESATLFALMHLPGLGCSKKPTTSPPDSAGRGRFARLKLRADRLQEQRAFYSETLGLPVVEESEQSFTIQAGETALEFERAGDQAAPWYHFAFNIPENKLAKAKKWLSRRCPLLRYRCRWPRRRARGARWRG